jgi:hypothetical protein
MGISGFDKYTAGGNAECGFVVFNKKELCSFAE